MVKLSTVKWGFIGCGEVTEKKSGPAFTLVEHSEVVAVMSRDKSKAESYAKRHNIKKFYSDAQALIEDPEVNAVYIATPPSSHATYAIMAMRAGKPAYVEKPLAISYEECIRINRISRLLDVPCFVAYYRRYLPYFQKVKELCENGRIGKVLSVQMRLVAPPREFDYNSNNLPWRLIPDVAGGGGYFYDLASHQFDLIQYMFGDIIEAEGFCCNMGKLYKVQDTFNAAFRFASGLTGSASWCFVAHESSRADKIEVLGEKGTIVFSVYNYNPIRVYSESGNEEITIANPQYVQMNLIQQIVDHLRGTANCDCDSVSATTANWVMDKILGKF
ncbi:MAG: Gfo/Idh/MocA family oxidoreductase [Bacteroidaceae bacterium]|jgi:predicted dehydrogenase|nr:Gfo/Idh/MocA family oxidoreductase [Bacteroidaceae bacterium]